jgi:two-component system response regulator
MLLRRLRGWWFDISVRQVNALNVADPKTVLLIEDDPVYAEFIASGVARLGLRLYHVSTLERALAYVRGEPPYSDRSAYPLPGAVLLDVSLGGGKSWPVLEFLRDNGHLEHEAIRVVMLTASERPEDLQEALRLGALSYVVKSPSASAVQDLLKRFTAAGKPSEMLGKKYPWPQ